MKLYLYKVLGTDETDPDIEWIAVKGNHIPIKKGSSKEETGKQIAEFFEKKGESIKTQKETKHSVYTGSGKHFDKPSTKYIGTAQGATMHGWGLYFSKNRRVAKYYRESFTPFELNGKELKVPQDIPQDMVERLEDAMEWKENKPDLFESYVKNIEGRLERANSDLEKYKKDEETFSEERKGYARTFQQWSKEAIKDIEWEKTLVEGIKNGTLKHDLSKGQILRARIPADKYMLQENKKFEEQSPLVQKALIELENKYNVIGHRVDFKGAMGHSVYSQLVNHIFKDNRKKASEELYKYGIKGIKYTEGNDENFVVFNDKDIRVEKINRTGDSND